MAGMGARMVNVVVPNGDAELLHDDESEANDAISI